MIIYLWCKFHVHSICSFENRRGRQYDPPGTYRILKEPGTNRVNVGDSVRVQNQSGNHPNKWDKTGIVVEIGDNDKYIVRIDGSRRLTLRNRRYLRKMKQMLPDSHINQPAIPHVQPLLQQLVSPQPSLLPSGESPICSDASPTAVQEEPHKQPQIQLKPALKISPPLDPETENVMHGLNTPIVAVPEVSKRGPGRPPRRVNFNLNHTNHHLSDDLVPSSPQQQRLSEQTVVPPAPQQQRLSEPPLVPPAPSPAPLLRRLTRITKKPGWYTSS